MSEMGVLKTVNRRLHDKNDELRETLVSSPMLQHRTPIQSQLPSPRQLQQQQQQQHQMMVRSRSFTGNSTDSNEELRARGSIQDEIENAELLNGSFLRASPLRRSKLATDNSFNIKDAKNKNDDIDDEEEEEVEEEEKETKKSKESVTQTEVSVKQSHHNIVITENDNGGNINDDFNNNFSNRNNNNNNNNNAVDSGFDDGPSKQFDDELRFRLSTLALNEEDAATTGAVDEEVNPKDDDAISKNDEEISPRSNISRVSTTSNNSIFNRSSSIRRSLRWIAPGSPSTSSSTPTLSPQSSFRSPFESLRASFRRRTISSKSTSTPKPLEAKMEEEEEVDENVKKQDDDDNEKDTYGKNASTTSTLHRQMRVSVTSQSENIPSSIPDRMFKVGLER